jgi:hypothetical protein
MSLARYRPGPGCRVVPRDFMRLAPPIPLSNHWIPKESPIGTADAVPEFVTMRPVIF